MMKKTLIAAGILATQALFTQAFAQGEVGPVKKPPMAQVVPEAEKNQARAERQAEGAAAARQQPQGLVGPVKKPAPAGVQTSDTTRAEKKEGAAAANQAMNKSPMPQRGELGQTKATN